MSSMGWGGAHAGGSDKFLCTDLCLLHGMLCGADGVELLDDGVGQRCIGISSSLVRVLQRVLARGEQIGPLDIDFFPATRKTSRRKRTSRSRRDQAIATINSMSTIMCPMSNSVKRDGSVELVRSAP